MNAAQAYARCKLLASTPEIATVCEQFEHLATGTEASPTLAVHRLLAEKAPTPQSREMHTWIAMLLAQVVEEETPLTLAHVAMWAAISRHFVMNGVRQAAAQFAIETETLVAALSANEAKTAEQILAARAESDNLSALLETQAKAHGNQIEKMLENQKLLDECIAYARVKRGKDFDYDTWENMCAHAMRGERAPSVLENEIALHAITRDALEKYFQRRSEVRKLIRELDLQDGAAIKDFVGRVSRIFDLA